MITTAMNEDEIAALDAESPEVLGHIKALL